MIAILLGVLLFAVMATGTAHNLRVRSFAVALAVSAAAASWLVVNNNNFEGPILLRLNDQHGLTVADLVAYGFESLALAEMLLVRRAAHRRGQLDSTAVALRLRCAQTVVCAAIFTAGLVASYYYQP